MRNGTPFRFSSSSGLGGTTINDATASLFPSSLLATGDVRRFCRSSQPAPASSLLSVRREWKFSACSHTETVPHNAMLRTTDRVGLTVAGRPLCVETLYLRVWICCGVNVGEVQCWKDTLQRVCWISGFKWEWKMVVEEREKGNHCGTWIYWFKCDGTFKTFSIHREHPL